MTGYDMNVPRAQFEKQIKEETMRTKEDIIAVVLAVVVGVAFLAVVLAPMLGLHTDPQTTTVVIGMFTALAGAYGMSLYKEQRVKTLEAHLSALSERGVL